MRYTSSPLAPARVRSSICGFFTAPRLPISPSPTSFFCPAAPSRRPSFSPAVPPALGDPRQNPRTHSARSLSSIRVDRCHPWLTYRPRIPVARYATPGARPPRAPAASTRYDLQKPQTSCINLLRSNKYRPVTKDPNPKLRKPEPVTLQPFSVVAPLARAASRSRSDPDFSRPDPLPL
jgi:hypothetical protein